MSFFTSSRERRLWLWTLVVIVTIYLTLGFAPTLAELLPDSGGIGAGLFMVACLLVLAAAVTQGLKTAPKRAEISVAMGITAVYLLVFVRMTIPAERTHLIEYGVIAILIYEALTERTANGASVPKPALLAILLTGLAGVVDEVIQAFLPSRVFDPRDILFNILAAVMAVTASVMLAWAREWGRDGA